MKNFIFGVLAVILVGSIALNGYFYMQKQKESKIVVTPTTTPTKEPLIGGQTDEHGCLGPAGYSWCEAKKKCLRVWEEKCEEEAKVSDADLIKAALYTKNKWETTMPLELDITENDGTYARGSAGGAEGGGYWFAQKVNGIWEIVADGNGTISCESLAKYSDYPKTYIPECYDSVAGKSVKR